MSTRFRESVAGVRAVVAGTARRARRTDLMLVAGGLTFYAVLGVVPLLLVAVRIAALMLGPDSVQRTAVAVGRYLPGELHVDRAVVSWSHASIGVGWWSVLVAVLPVSLYSEGIVRALERFSPAGGSPGVRRGRALTPVLLGLALVLVVLGVVVGRPLLTASFGTGTPARLLGIFVAFCAGWVAFAFLLAVFYRWFATARPSAPALVWGAAAAGSWLAGQSLGFVLVLRLARGVGTAYGGSVAAGAVATMIFLTYLNHIVFLLGYALTLTGHERPALLRAVMAGPDVGPGPAVLGARGADPAAP